VIAANFKGVSFLLFKSIFFGYKIPQF